MAHILAKLCNNSNVVMGNTMFQSSRYIDVSNGVFTCTAVGGKYTDLVNMTKTMTSND